MMKTSSVPSTGNKKIFTVILAVLVLMIIEAIPYAASPLLTGRAFSRSGLQQELGHNHRAQHEQADANEGSTPDEGYLSGHVLHPYIGYVSKPREGYNRFGFKGEDPVLLRSDDAVNVCITGGSVAMGLYPFLKNELTERLSRSEAFKGREVRVAVLALGGFKQPQQLLALNYFMALGAHYDLVINVDGFNEIVLPYSDNLPFGIFPAYPRHWNIFSRKKIDTRVQSVLARQLVLRADQARLTDLFVGWHLSKSNLGLLVWDVLNNTKKMALAHSENDLRAAIEGSESDYQVTGPAEAVSDTAAFFAQQAELWARASISMAGMAEWGGFAYFHFLQPNQYLPGSKQLTETELNIAFEHGDFAYKTAVLQGYPHLVRQGADLSQHLVNFHDLTPMFRKEPRTVYSDKCCHFNDLGYTLMAKEVTDRVLKHYTGQN